MIYAPGWNEEPEKTERIGDTDAYPITIHSRSDIGILSDLGICNGFAGTGPDTGIFVGHLKLSGHDHDINGDGIIDKKFGKTKCSNSPIDEYAKIEAGREGAVTLNWKYQDDPEKIVSKTIHYHWNVGELEFLQNQYHDTVYVEYYDCTLPKDIGLLGLTNSRSDCVEVIAKTTVFTY